MQKIIASPAVYSALAKAGLVAKYGRNVETVGRVTCSLVEGQTIDVLASLPPLMATAIAERGGHRASFNVAPYLTAPGETNLLILAQAEADFLMLAQAGWRQDKDGDILMDTLHLADGVEPEVTAFLEKMSQMIASGVDEVYWRVEITPDAALAWLKAAHPDIAAKIAPTSVADAEEEQSLGMGM
jgi:hypothetical protein